jgi:LytS/YehU family sensor histidine kinase
MLLLGFLRFSVFDNFGIPVYFDAFFKLPFATLLEMVVFSFAIAAKISYDNKLRLESEKRLRETEMIALRSQMNPHFIFNSLNTVRSFILQNDTANANKYLSKFSKLLRQILNFSRSNVIMLTEELETVRLYIELESARFESGFRYEINVPEALETDAIPIPPLLLQPYVENAIWHGLRHSIKAEKVLVINVVEQEGTLTISILDNGVGRKEAEKLKSETKDSLGTKITQERIELFNFNENSTLRVETKDAASGGGTEVILTYQLY